MMTLYLLRVPPQSLDQALFVAPMNGSCVVGIEKGRSSSESGFAEVLFSPSNGVDRERLTEDELLEQVFQSDNIFIL